MTALGALANQMHRRLWVRLEATRGRMVASDNLAALGRMTAGIAHEIKTPVAAILATTHTFRLLTDELRHSIGNPSVTEDDLRAIALDLDEGMNVVDTSAQKVADFVHAIREHTRSLNDVRCEAFDVRERLHEVELLLGHRIKRSHMAVEISADPGLKLRGDPGKFDQIVSNLLVNALDAADESGKGTTIRVAARSVPTGVSVSVEDDGPGVPENIRERIFEPLYTTRLGSGGSGLGLSISRDIAVAVFGGTLTLVPRPRGAAFVLLCPHEGMPRVQRTEWAPAC